MSEAGTKVPMSFWIVAGIATAWNLIGLMIYYQQMTVTPEVLAQSLSPEQVAFLTQTFRSMRCRSLRSSCRTCTHSCSRTD